MNKAETEKWTLVEGIKRLALGDPEAEAEAGDLITYSRQLTFDISIAEEQDPNDGTAGISVILSVPIADDKPSADESQDSRSQSLFWDFCCFMIPAEGESMSELIERIAATLGIKPDERVWQDTDEILS